MKQCKKTIEWLVPERKDIPEDVIGILFLPNDDSSEFYMIEEYYANFDESKYEDWYNNDVQGIVIAPKGFHLKCICLPENTVAKYMWDFPNGIWHNFLGNNLE